MKHSNYLIIVIILMLAGFLLSAHISQSNSLRVATDPNLPPFEYFSGEDGTDIAGFDIAIAEHIARNARMRLEIVQVPFHGIISAVEEGRADIAIAAIPIDTQWATRIDFSSSYYTATQVLVSRMHEQSPRKIEDLHEESIAIHANSIGKLAVSEFTFPHTLLTFTSNESMFNALRDKRATAVVVDEEIARYYVNIYPDLIITDIGLEQLRYAVVIRKNGERISRIVNRTIRDLKNTEEYRQLIEKYIVPQLAHSIQTTN